MASLMTGDRVATDHGYGTVVEVLRDWSHGVCELGWEHQAGGQPPARYVIRLDRCGELIEVSDPPRRVALAGTCDP